MYKENLREETISIRGQFIRSEQKIQNFSYCSGTQVFNSVLFALKGKGIIAQATPWGRRYAPSHALKGHIISAMNSALSGLETFPGL